MTAIPDTTSLIPAQPGWAVVIRYVDDSPDDLVTAEAISLGFVPIIAWRIGDEQGYRRAIAVTLNEDFELNDVVLRTPSGMFCDQYSPEFDEVEARRCVFAYAKRDQGYLGHYRHDFRPPGNINIPGGLDQGGDGRGP